MPEINLPLENLGETPRERRLLSRVGMVVLALLVGALAGTGAYAWAENQVAMLRLRTDLVENRLNTHVAETKGDPDDVAEIRKDVKVLLRDCWRRGGCQDDRR